MSELNLLIRKRAEAPLDPEARSLYVHALKRQHQAGLLKAQIERGLLPASLMETLIPDLTGPQRLDARMEG